MNAHTRPDPAGATTEAGTLGLWITADGGITSVTLPADECQRFEALRELVEGSIDLVRLSKDLDMWVNDDGLYQFDANTVACRIAGVFGFDWQPYHGPALFAASPDAHGVERGLDGARAALLADLAFEAAHDDPLEVDEVDGTAPAPTAT